MGPETNLIRHEVQRPRPPHVDVISIPAVCAALRREVPGGVGTTVPPGSKVTETTGMTPLSYQYLLSSLPVSRAGSLP